MGLVELGWHGVGSIDHAASSGILVYLIELDAEFRSSATLCRSGYGQDQGQYLLRNSRIS